MMAGRPRDFTWVSVGFGVQLSAQFGRAILLARLLTPHDLGLYFVLRSVAGVVAIVVPLGLGLIGLRRVAAVRGDAVAARAAVRTTLRLTTAGSLVAVPAAWLCVRIAGFGAVDATLVAAMIVALAWTGVLADLTRGLGGTRESVGIEKIAGSLVDVAGLTVILVIARQSTLTVALGIVACAAMFPVAGLAIALMRALTGQGAAPFASSAGQAAAVTSGALLSESWPVAANALFWRALAEVDLWMVAWLTGPEETALYGLATRLAAPLELPKTMAIYLLSAPIATLYAGGHRRELERLLKLWARRASAGAVVAFGAVVLIGPAGLEFVFGDGYGQAMPLFIVVGIGQLVNVAAGFGGTTLLMTGHSRALLQISVFSSSLAALVALSLIPPLGVIGAAFASSCGRAIQSFLMVRAVRRYADVSVHAGPGSI